MSSVISMIGGGGGAGGTGFSGPQGANVVNPVTADQIKGGYEGSQASLDQQKNLLAALQAQNGLGNQTNVFGQMQGVANGTGPNPAQAQLAQATGANVASQNAMAAGQRGAGANVGMMQRQAAQTGAGIQQQSAGQAATLQANQSLNALNQMGGMANQMVGQQVGQTNANTQAQQAQYQSMLNAQQGVNNSNVGMQSNINQANAGMANTRMGQQGAMVGGLLQGAASGMSMFADGGDVVQQPAAKSKFGQFLNKATAGPEAQSAGSAPLSDNQQLNKGAQAFGKSLFQPSKGAPPPGQIIAGGPMDTMPIEAPVIDSQPDISFQGPMMAAEGGNVMGLAMKLAPMIMAAHGGKVPALVSPGEQYIPPEQLHKVAKGADPLSVGERIPGKPKYPGNDYRNDTVKKTLKEGGLVIPNEIMQAKNPHWAAKKFVEAHMAKQAGRGLKPSLKGKK